MPHTLAQYTYTLSLLQVNLTSDPAVPPSPSQTLRLPILALRLSRGHFFPFCLVLNCLPQPHVFILDFRDLIFLAKYPLLRGRAAGDHWM